MSKNHKKEVPWVDLGLYHRNRCRVPAEYLEPYRGQFVAWSLDGKRILASAKTEAALFRRLRAAGIASGQFVGDYIDPPDAIYY